MEAFFDIKLLQNWVQNGGMPSQSRPLFLGLSDHIYISIKDSARVHSSHAVIGAAIDGTSIMPPHFVAHKKHMVLLWVYTIGGVMTMF
jgi:hypothetical protein